MWCCIEEKLQNMNTADNGDASICANCGKEGDDVRFDLIIWTHYVVIGYRMGKTEYWYVWDTLIIRY
jgi:hypothetical protein